jgi:hypothetical protein
MDKDCQLAIAAAKEKYCARVAAAYRLADKMLLIEMEDYFTLKSICAKYEYNVKTKLKHILNQRTKEIEEIRSKYLKENP